MAEQEELKVVDFVRDGNMAYFNFFRAGVLYYKIQSKNGKEYVFPVDVEDLDGASVFDTEKSILLMRYIRKAIKAGTMVPFV